MTVMALPVVLALLALAGCRSATEDDQSLTIRQAAEDMIRTDVATEAGLGDLSPVCPEVGDAVVGSVWACSATTADQRVVQVAGSINTEGRIELVTSNLITARALPSFERAAVAALNNEVGTRLADDAVDCGETAVIFPADTVMVCALFDPHTEQLYDVTLSIADIEARQFSLVVADQPRP